MRFYFHNDLPDGNYPFGLVFAFSDALPRPWLCVYLQWELDEYIAKHRNPKVGFLVAERYLRTVVQPMVDGDVLLATEYP